MGPEPGMEPGAGMHRPPMDDAFGLARGQFWNHPKMIQRLNLTVGQRKAMDGILQEHRMKLIDLRANLERAEVALDPMIKGDTPDRKAIEAQIDRIVAARSDLERANALFLLDIRMQLNAGQWKQLQALRAQRMDRPRMEGRGAWQPGAQGPGMGPNQPSGTEPAQPPAPPASASEPGSGEMQ